MTIGERIRQARESKQLSLGDVAQRVGITKQALSYMENNHTTFRTAYHLYHLSQILETSMETLLGVEERACA